MKKNSFSKFAILISLIFIIASAFNDGFSRFAPAIPFYFVLSIFSNKLNLNTKLRLSFLCIVIASILLNVNLSKFSWAYPITNGTITFKQDGFIHHYSDNSASFSTSSEKISCTGCGEIKLHEVKAGQVLKVLSVATTHPDFSTRYVLVTEKGNISIPTDNEAFTLSAPVSSPILLLGNLMYYPAIPILIIGIKSSITNLI